MEQTEKKEKKIRLLALCDSPTAATGFAQVSRNVLNGLYATGKYDIDVIGINFHGDAYDRYKFPYNIFPAQPQGWADMYGRGRLIQAMGGNQIEYGLTPPWDIVFTIQDPFVIEGMGLNFPFGEQLRVSSEMWKRITPMEAWFKWVGYFPVDSDLKENWVNKGIAPCQYPVAYCAWGKKQILKHDKPEFGLKFSLAQNQGQNKRQARMPLESLKDRVRVIHHGVDTEVFKPLRPDEKREFRKKYFENTIDEDTFLIVNVSRNQPRKDLARTIYAYSLFKKRVPKSHLYLHCKDQDAGGSIEEIARNYGLVLGKDYSLPQSFNPGIGFPVTEVNKIYNIADLCITTTLGEGWGFITTEAMATKTPIIAPNITSMLDIFNSYEYDGSLSGLEQENELRGIPARAGSSSSEWFCMGLDDNERVRPLTNVDDLVDKMEWVYKHRASAALTNIIERAYKWVQDLNWPAIVSQWDAVITGAYQDLERERSIGYAIDKAGRNDDCPCGSGKKFKVCHGSDEMKQQIKRFDDWLVGQDSQEVKKQ